MISEVNNLTATFEGCGGWYTYLHNLNPNVSSEARQLEELKKKAKWQNMLREYGYRDNSF